MSQHQDPHFLSQNSVQGWLCALTPSLRELMLVLPTVGSSVPQGQSPPAVSLPDSRCTKSVKVRAAGHSPGNPLEGGSAWRGWTQAVWAHAHCGSGGPDSHAPVPTRPAAPVAPLQTMRTRAGVGSTLETPPATAPRQNGSSGQLGRQPGKGVLS